MKQEIPQGATDDLNSKRISGDMVAAGKTVTKAVHLTNQSSSTVAGRGGKDGYSFAAFHLYM